MERQIKFGDDLSKTLSVELARAKNDNKYMTERLSKLMDENATLGQQIKGLTSTKVALEKSIVKLTEQKNDIEKKLDETEGVIQNRIEEIWEIKDSIDKKLNPSQSNSSSNEIELPPIVVSPEGGRGGAKKNLSKQEKNSDSSQGQIVSINESNNFVIVDMGENSGLKVGNELNVYRGSQYVAGLEVIQTRKDISAADIKQKVSDIKVGDSVR